MQQNPQIEPNSFRFSLVTVMADPDHVTKFSTLAPLHALAANYTSKEGRETVAAMETFLTSNFLPIFISLFYGFYIFASPSRHCVLIQ